MSGEGRFRPHFVQNREIDKRTSFIYKCKNEDEVKLVADRNSLNDNEIDYAVWRWHNYRAEDDYNHEMVSQSLIISNNNPVAQVIPIPRKEDGTEDDTQYYMKFQDVKFNKSGRVEGPKNYFTWDLKIVYPNGKERYFDTKCTSFKPQGGFATWRETLIREYKETASISPNTSQNLVEELYRHQSKNNSVRYGNGPRLFFCFISLKDGIYDDDLKTDEKVREEVIGQLFNDTDILTNPKFSRRTHSIEDINELLIRNGIKPNDFDHVGVAIYYVIMNENGTVRLVDGNK